MAKGQRKPINSILKGYTSNEIEFGSNSTITYENILNHVKTSQCSDCNWFFAIIGHNNLKEIKKFSQDCLVAMYGELLFIQGLPEKLKKQGLNENETFKPREIQLIGAILIYCEKVSTQ